MEMRKDVGDSSVTPYLEPNWNHFVSWLSIVELCILIAACIVLAAILVDDLKNYRIRNTTVLILAGLFIIWCLIRGDLWLFVSHSAFAAMVFVIMATMYHFSMLGGGDVKLLTIAFLWLGLENGFLFCLFLCGASLVYILFARLGWVPSRKLDDRTSIPYGPSIVMAWIMTILIAHVPKALAW
jgi:prepilin peptidase CpaA